MTSTRQTWFISELHLSAREPDVADRFLALLTKCSPPVDALYILGDLFEFWIGDDDMTPFHQRILTALKATTERGTPIYFMHGNRDFLIGNKFLQQTGCQLLIDPTLIHLYGTNILLMHGDTLCLGDVAYLKSRKWMRQPLLQRVYLMLPISLRRSIAEKLRANSMQHIETQPSENMDADVGEVARVMKAHHVTTMIHGHTHKQHVHELSNGHTILTRIVLPAWDHVPETLVYEEDGKFEWIKL